jgi:hypothetical protein
MPWPALRAGAAPWKRPIGDHAIDPGRSIMDEEKQAWSGRNAAACAEAPRRAGKAVGEGMPGLLWQGGRARIAVNWAFEEDF